MCTNKKWVRNPYSNQWFYANCGHCEACQQEKANKRVTRINNEWLSNSGLTCLFVELDYSNSFVPYVLKSEVDAFLEFPDTYNFNIYRGSKILSTLDKWSFCDRGKLPEFDSLELRSDFLTSFTPRFHYLQDKVAVLYKPDIQRFFKRLKINLFRAGYDGYFSYFYASDYGGKRKRCHFHTLLYFESRYYSRFIDILCKSWPFSDLSKPRRQKDGTFKFRYEVARNPAKYVASYVTKREDVSSLLCDTKPFRPMYHFSNGFGCHYKEFSLDSLISKVNRGTLYYVARRIKQGVSSTCNVQIPKYVLLRYFPKFKGFNALFPDEVFQLALEPSRITHFAERCGLSKADSVQIYLKLCALRRRCFEYRKLVDIYDWAFAYSRVWPLYYSCCLVDSWKDVRFSRDVFEHFDNIGEYLAGMKHNALLDSYRNEFIRYRYSPDPKLFNRTTAVNISLIKEFRKQKHHHQLKNNYYE